MRTEELIARLEGLTLPNEEFKHRQHVATAFYYIRRDGVARGTSATARAIRAFAEHHGHARKFHLTMTLCWSRLVAAALAEDGPCETDDVLVSRHPALMDKQLPLRYYSRAVLFSEEARRGWVEPDLQPLPRIDAPPAGL
jgi:hypothetical protein